MDNLLKLIGDYFSLFLAQNALERAEPRGEQYEVLDRIKMLDSILREEFYKRLQNLKRDWENHEDTERIRVLELSKDYFEKKYLIVKNIND